MYQRKSHQISILEDPNMFGGIQLNPKNKWVRLSKLVPWAEFEEKYAENFRSNKGQPAIPARMALGALLINERFHGMSDEDVTEEIGMNPYLQYFIGMEEYRMYAPFHHSMMSRFRKRITPEMLAWVNDRICDVPEEKDDQKPIKKENDQGKDDNGTPSGSDQDITVKPSVTKEKNEGTLILDATCAPQAIRFPLDASLLNEARENLEQMIDILHENKMTDGNKPRTYREKARHEYNSFSKKRKKTQKDMRKAVGKQLQYVRRDLGYIDVMLKAYPDCLLVLPSWLQTRLPVVRQLYKQQLYMHENRIHRCDNRIVSLSQNWVRPIVRGKQNADVEFGAKVEMSVINGYLRIEDLRWDAFNESTTLQESAQRYLRVYGHYPARILADTIFRTRANLAFCREQGIHMNGPKLGKPSADETARKEQLLEEWRESGERGEIERDFGVGKRRYSLGQITAKLQATSESMIHLSVLSLNLWKKLRLLLRILFYEIQFWSPKVVA